MYAFTQPFYNEQSVTQGQFIKQNTPGLNLESPLS